jgi:hypothetical protein
MTVTINGTSGVTFPDSSTQAVGFYGFKNRIINGSTLINQRGVTSGVTSGYFVDRWQISGLTTSSLITTSLPNNFTQAISLNRTSAAGTMTAYQSIEAKNCLDLVGATVTVSFWAQNVTGITSITVTLNYANSADTFSSVTAITTVTVSSSPSGSWTYYTATYTSLPSGVANGLQLVIGGVTASTGTLGITGVQLEKGSTATSFDYRPYGTELMLCQRYYYKIAGNGTTGTTSFMSPGVAYSATQTAQHYGAHPVTMRATPTATASGITLYNPLVNASAGIDSQNNSTTVATLNFSATGTSFVTGQFFIPIQLGTSTASLAFTAEL